MQKGTGAGFNLNGTQTTTGQHSPANNTSSLLSHVFANVNQGLNGHAGKSGKAPSGNGMLLLDDTQPDMRALMVHNGARTTSDKLDDKGVAP